MAKTDYERLLCTLAKALQTQRRFIVLICETPLDGNKTAYSVKVHGFGYRVTMNGKCVTEISRETVAV